MKKISFLIVVLGFVACVSSEQKNNDFLGKSMPEIVLVSLDSSVNFNTKAIPLGQPTIIFSFEPWCPYCAAQTEEMINNIKRLHGVSIYMLTASDTTSVREYAKKYGLSRYANIKVALDTAKTFRRYFNDGTIPYIAIYDRKKKLDRVFVGKSDVREIIYAINQN